MIDIRRTNLEFGTLERREETNRFILHHAGVIDRDFSAEEIHAMHRSKAWSGIGYHFVIRKDGTIERGRPEWAVGAHTRDNNYDSIGINVAGDFDIGVPTEAQLRSAAALLRYLCDQYKIAIDANSIVGHCDLAVTVCPGKNLYDRLPEIRAMALGMRRETRGTSIFSLSAKYESNGNPAEVSDGNGDLGGTSYGIYQFSSNAGTVQAFLAFARGYSNDALANYGRVLSQHAINSAAFIENWRSIGTIDPGGFTALQDAYAKAVYYEPAARNLKKAYYDMKTKSPAMQAVLFSRAIQYGSGNMVELYMAACDKLGHPNLSYVDAAYFDRVMIAAIYDFLIEECDSADEVSDGRYHSPNDWVNGSAEVVKAGLKNRFIREKSDALAML